MSTKMKMNGPQSDILKGSVSIMAMAKTLEGQMLTMADQIGQALAEDLVNSDHGSDRLSQDVMLAFGALEEMVESFVEALDEKVEHYDGDDQVEITEEGRRALSCDEDGNIRIPLSKDAAEEVSRYLRKINDQANYDRARGADSAPHFPPGTELQATSFVTSGARLKTFRDGVSDRVTVGDIASELNLDRAIVSILVEDLHPVADFEGEAVYSRKEVCALQPPIMPFVSAADLAEEFELSFEAVHCALFDADVPAMGFQNCQPIYDREVALYALRNGPLKANIARVEGGSDWRKAKTLFEAVGLNS